MRGWHMNMRLELECIWRLGNFVLRVAYHPLSPWPLLGYNHSNWWWHKTRFTYSQCKPHAHLNDLWTNMCITTVYRRGMCFWDGWPWSIKSEKDSKGYVERLWGCECSFEPHRTRGFGRFSTAMQFLCFASRCSSLSYSMIVTSPETL